MEDGSSLGWRERLGVSEGWAVVGNKLALGSTDGHTEGIVVSLGMTEGPKLGEDVRLGDCDG